MYICFHIEYACNRKKFFYPYPKMNEFIKLTISDYLYAAQKKNIRVDFVRKIHKMDYFLEFKIKYRVPFLEKLYFILTKKFPQKTINDLQKLLTNIKEIDNIEIVPLVTTKFNFQSSSEINRQLTEILFLTQQETN